MATTTKSEPESACRRQLHTADAFATRVIQLIRTSLYFTRPTAPGRGAQLKTLGV